MSLLDDLREFGGRPIPDERRRGLAVIVGGGLILFAVALFAFQSLVTPPRVQEDPPVRAAAADGPAADPLAAGPAAIDEERERPSTTSPAPGLSELERAARLFLRGRGGKGGYLDYSYGRGRAEEIPAAAPGLIDELASNPPRVPAAQRRIRPKLGPVIAEGATSTRATVIATINDPEQIYSVSLSMELLGGKWTTMSMAQ